MLKVVITGPESTGKSTLAKELSVYFESFYVKEFARTYLTKIGRNYMQKDLVEIAKGQIKMQANAEKKNLDLLIYDTSLEVLKIWSEFKYGYCDPYIIKQFTNRLPDLYLLMTPDLPWIADPLRENPTKREELFEIYKKELNLTGVPYYEITGSGKNRFEMCKNIVSTKIAN